MGVPFEALLPYGIVVGVRITRQCSGELQLTTTIDVQHFWHRPSLCQALLQRGQEDPLEPGSLGSCKFSLWSALAVGTSAERIG